MHAAVGAPFDRMSDDVETPILEEHPAADSRQLQSGADGGSDGLNGAIPFAPPKRRWRRRRDGRPPKPKLRKLRLLVILTGLGALAVVSTVFGMMMAVASDLPLLNLRDLAQTRHNSYLYDDRGRALGILEPPNNVVVDTFQEMSPYMRRAIVSIEDKRFWTDPGVDIRGIARAFLSDLTGGARQGASTIAQQFVKNALAAENNRTILEKLREAALAYHLTHRWARTKILEQYLNSIYFGNGAYGVESAARVYFGKALGFGTAASNSSSTDSSGSDSSAPKCGDSIPGQPLPKCAELLQPYQAALLAGMVANPSAFDPFQHPLAALERRDVVLQDMRNEGYLSQQQYVANRNEPLPQAKDLEQPEEPTAAPYFTSWIRPQIISALVHLGVPKNIAAYRAFYGGLKIKTTIDLPMQQAAEQAVAQNLPYHPGQPTASLVAIDNKTGEVRAMVGGPVISDSNGNVHEDYADHPFNLATQGYRQAGSSFKPFTLAEALWHGGYTPDSVIDSAPQDFIVPNSGGKEHFIVHNFGNSYSGPITLTQATTISDNSVYSQVGIHTGPAKIARLAQQMGIRTPVSSNYAMILGAMKHGVSPLDMAHAYETFAEGGQKVYDPVLGDQNQGPTGIAEIQCPQSNCNGHTDVKDTPMYKRILPAPIAQTVHDILATVVQSGTGTAAQISGVDVVGKTGTTSNYGDAWFVGWTPQLTVAVWVGVPDKLVPMATDYNGGPVEGGTYPAVIWQAFMSQALQILQSEQPQTKTTSTATDTPAPTSTGNTGVPATTTGASTATPNGGNNNGGANNGGNTGNTGGGGGGGGTTGGTQGGGGPTGNSGGGPTGNSGGGGGGGTGNGGGGGGTGNSGGGGGGGTSGGGGGGGGGSGGAGSGGAGAGGTSSGH